MTKRKTYPEEMSHKEVLIFAGIAATMMTFANMSQWIKTSSHFLTVTLTSLIPMIIIGCGLNYYRVTSYRKGYEQGRKHERNMQDICMNIKSSIEKKSTNE